MVRLETEKDNSALEFVVLPFTSWHSNKSISEMAPQSPASMQLPMSLAVALQCLKSELYEDARKIERMTSLDAGRHSFVHVCVFAINYCQRLHPFWPSRCDGIFRYAARHRRYNSFISFVRCNLPPRVTICIIFTLPVWWQMHQTESRFGGTHFTFIWLFRNLCTWLFAQSAFAHVVCERAGHTNQLKIVIIHFDGACGSSNKLIEENQPRERQQSSWFSRTSTRMGS